MTTIYKIAFTGHRPQKLDNPTGTKRKISEFLAGEKEKHKRLLVISGGALGVDQYAAEAANALNIPYMLILPFPPKVMGAKWWANARDNLKKLIAGAVKTFVIQKAFSFQGYQDRNEAMVNHCNSLCAIFDGLPGGTANCVKYAESKGCNIHLIKP